MELTLENRDEFENLIKSHDVVMVEFYSTWCPPCKMFRPILEEYMEDHPDDFCITVNTDNVKDIHKKYGVRTVPTLVFFKNGEVADTIDGYCEPEDLEETFEELREN